MSKYRVRYKKGDFEVEIESSEKEYVDSKLTELLDSTLDAKAPKDVKKKKASKRKPKISREDQESKSESDDNVDILSLVEAINGSEDRDSIETNILEKSNALNRIILCLKFAELIQDSPYLSTGHIQAITDQLNVKITSQNAGTKIKANQKYFAADGVRKTGAQIKYKLNRKGLTAYESILKGEKV